MPSKIRLSDVIKGCGAEFIFLGQGAPVIISGGQRFTLELVVDSNSATIYLSGGDSDLELCSGGISDVTETYQSLTAELRRTKAPSIIKTHSRFLLGTIVGAVLASAVAVLTMLPTKNEGKLSEEAIYELMELAEAKTRMQTGLPSATNLQNVVPTIQQIVPQLPLVQPNVQPSLPPIVDRPDFLKKPEVTPPAVEAVPAGAATGEVEEAQEEEAFRLPAFDPEIFKAMAEGAEPKAETVTSKEPEAEPTVEAQPEPKAEEAPVQAEEPEEVVKNAPAAATEPEKAASKEDEKPKEMTTDPQSPTSDNTLEEAEEAFVPPSPEETRQQANEVVATLLRDGMTPGQATDVLQTLEALAMADFGEITPEMFARLPHEVAQLLRDNGLVDMMEPAYTDGVPHRIIRLPDEVLDQYRGKDGIPTIPEANTWAATGNAVTIPPPGGGDLKSPEDFAAFGIKLP